MESGKKDLIIPLASATFSTICAVGWLISELKRRSTRPKEVNPPHPKWKAGDRQNSPYSDSQLVKIDPANMSNLHAYTLMISCVVPRPIAFVSSISSEGNGNLSPFSYFSIVSHFPPHISISVCRDRKRPGLKQKDTCRNILETKEFCVNLISEWFVEAAESTSRAFDPEENEMEAVGLTPIPSEKINPPRVAESAIQMECKLVHSHDILYRTGEVSSTLFVGEVVMFHINEAVLKQTESGNPYVDVSKLCPMGRLGGSNFCRINTFFHISSRSSS